MVLRAVILVTGLALFGCNQQMEQFVAGAGPKKDDGPPPALISAVSNDTIKRSPGAIRAQGGGLSLRAHITPTSQPMTGGGISARVGIGAIQIK